MLVGNIGNGAMQIDILRDEFKRVALNVCPTNRFIDRSEEHRTSLRVREWLRGSELVTMFGSTRVTIGAGSEQKKRSNKAYSAFHGKPLERRFLKGPSRVGILSVVLDPLQN